MKSGAAVYEIAGVPPSMRSPNADLPSGAPEGPNAAGTAPVRLARAVSYALSPLTVPPILVALILLFFGAPLNEVIAVTATVFVLLTAAPALALVRMVRTGKAESLHVGERTARSGLFVLALASGLVALPAVLLIGRTATGVVAVLLMAYLINASILMAINRFWKISLHAAAAAGFGAAVLFIGGATWAVPHAETSLWVLLAGSILIAGSVGWARLVMGLHTRSQVVGGWIVGTLATLVELAAAERMGLLAVT